MFIDNSWVFVCLFVFFITCTILNMSLKSLHVELTIKFVLYCIVWKGGGGVWIFSGTRQSDLILTTSLNSHVSLVSIRCIFTKIDHPLHLFFSFFLFFFFSRTLDDSVLNLPRPSVKQCRYLFLKLTSLLCYFSTLKYPQFLLRLGT